MPRRGREIHLVARVYRAVRAYVVEEPADRTIRPTSWYGRAVGDDESHVVGFPESTGRRRRTRFWLPPAAALAGSGLVAGRRFADDLQLGGCRYGICRARRGCHSNPPSASLSQSSGSVRSAGDRQAAAAPRGFGPRDQNRGVACSIVAPGRSGSVARLRESRCSADATATATASKRRPHSPRDFAQRTAVARPNVDRPGSWYHTSTPVARLHENPSTRPSGQPSATAGGGTTTTAVADDFCRLRFDAPFLQLQPDRRFIRHRSA